MVLKMPESMDECIYFTRRTLGENGNVMVWVYKKECPECGKGLMGKPVEKGKIKIRAKEYVCPECNYSLEKKEYEETLTAEAIYTCPHCKKEGEATTLFKRKSIKGVQTLRFQCEHCNKDLDITKKMKEPKK